jgi:hypothetical protein
MTNIRKETDLEKWENSISSSQGMIKTATVSGTVVAMKSDHRPAKLAPAYNTITADEVMQSLKETIHEIQAPPPPPNPFDKSGTWRKTRVMDKEATAQDILSELNTNLIHLNKRPPYKPAAMKLGDASLGGYGNFGVITGQLKSGKSHVIAAMVAAYLSDKITPLGFIGKPDNTRPDVLYFDTEMDLDDCWTQLDRLEHFKRIHGVQFIGSIHMYHLRAYAPPERLKMINQAIMTHHQRCGLVVIDGIRDLMYDINSTLETTEVISDLMRWTANFNIHMITALHENKTDKGGTNNMRGHIGTEIGNKANYVLKCKKEGSGLDAYFTLDMPISRKAGSIEPIGWRIEPYDIDSGGQGTIPILMDQSDYQLKTKSHSQGKSGRHTDTMPSELSDEVHQEIADKVFISGEALKHRDLRDKIRAEYFKKTGKELGENRANLYFQHWRDLGIITNKGTVGTRSCTWHKGND